jgi:hypothetical protein
LNGSVPLVTEDAGDGVIVTDVELGVPVTVNVTVADFVGSATLVAVIVPAPLAGAVNRPVLVIVPTDAVQVTDIFVVVPWIVAVNWVLPFGAGEDAAGVTATELAGPAGCLTALPTPTHPEVQSKLALRIDIVSANTRVWLSSFMFSFSLLPKFKISNVLPRGAGVL